MKIFKRWLIHLQIMFLLLRPVITLSPNISCSAGIATIGSPAKITCFFNSDIGSSQQNFVIWRFPLYTTDLADSTYRIDVLRCNWEEEGSLNCRATEGYEFNKQTVTTTASVDIPSATADQEGIYKCLLVTQEPIPTSPCDFTVQAREENQHIDNFISALTPTGAFILIVGAIVLCFIMYIALNIYCYKYTCRRKSDQSVQTIMDVHHRGNNTVKLEVVDSCVDTEDLTGRTTGPTIKEKSTGFFSRKDDHKKILTKPSTPKHSQEDLTKKEEEKQPLVQSSQPVSQFGPLIPMVDPKAEHSLGSVELTQEAVGGADVAEAGRTATMETSVDIGDPADTTQDTTKTDDETALNDNGNISAGKRRKKGILSFLKTSESCT